MHLTWRYKDEAPRLDGIAFIIPYECAGSRLDPSHMIEIVSMRDMTERDPLGQFLKRNTEAIVYLSAATGQSEQGDL
jgi:hypothetical protein